MNEETQVTPEVIPVPQETQPVIVPIDILQPITVELPEIKEIAPYNLPSGKLQIFLSDLKNLGREIAIYYSPVVLYVLYQIQSGAPIDTHTIIELGIGVTIAIFIKFIKDNTK